MNVYRTDKETSATENAKLLSTSPMLRLPNELLLVIFDAIDDLTSCICLCVTHKILGVAGEARIRELSIPKPGPWAGHHILCIGDYCYEFPAGVEEEISAQITAYADSFREGDSDASDTQGEDAGTPSFYECVSETYEKAQPPDQRLGRLHLAWYKLRFRLLSSVDRERVDTLVAAVTNVNLELDTYDKDLVLCNLSKGEYVRNDAEDGKNDAEDDKNGAEDDKMVVDLGLVLFSRICWSTDHSCSMPESVSDRLAMGPWAGDRFEIVPREKMGRNIEWKDITEEAVAWLRDIWESEH